jgi:hypothetical protein
MITYDEYDIDGETPIFNNMEEVKKACSIASLEELIGYHETCIAEKLYDYAKYISKIIKNEQAK